MRRVLTSLLAIVGVVLAGCSTQSRPHVTFYAHGDAIRVAPVIYCDPLGRDCSQPRPQAVETLAVPPSAPLQISVPEAVSTAPWQVVFRYRTSDGKKIEGRSHVFAPDKRHAFTLRIPDKGGPSQLLHVEVQRYAASLSLGRSGDLKFGIGASWAINVPPHADD